jgi:hypothetical protein
VVCIGRPLSGSPVRQRAGAQVQAKSKKILRGFSGSEGLSQVSPFGRHWASHRAAALAFAVFGRFRPMQPQIPMKSRDFDRQKNV